MKCWSKNFRKPTSTLGLARGHANEIKQPLAVGQANLCSVLAWQIFVQGKKSLQGEKITYENADLIGRSSIDGRLGHTASELLASLLFLLRHLRVNLHPNLSLELFNTMFQKPQFSAQAPQCLLTTSQTSTPAWKYPHTFLSSAQHSENTCC